MIEKTVIVIILNFLCSSHGLRFYKTVITIYQTYAVCGCSRCHHKLRQDLSIHWIIGAGGGGVLVTPSKVNMHVPIL